MQKNNTWYMTLLVHKHLEKLFQLLVTWAGFPCTALFVAIW